MNKKLRHLTLYLGAISFVVILFTFITTYGEANLKTVSKVEGTYIINSSIPNCQNVQLTIQQSGTYINAAIAPLGDNTKNGSELSGKWQQELVLSGNSHICKSLVAIAATVNTKDKAHQIIGKITISGNVSDFTATQIEIPQEKSKSY